MLPLSVISNWISQIEEHADLGSISVYTYRGPGRTSYSSPTLLSQHEVIITTYATLAQDLPPSSKAGKPTTARSGLFGCKFLRAVLDESHVCDNTKTLQS